MGPHGLLGTEVTPPYLQNGVILSSVLGIIALQKAAAHGGARTSELRQVEVSKAQLNGEEESTELLSKYSP